MARATRAKMKKGAHHVAMQARAFLRLLDARFGAGRDAFALFLTGLLTSIADIPAVRRSRLRREGLRLWRRLVLMMSDGYNFEEFYRTQHGAVESHAPEAVRSMDRLPTSALLAKAYELSDDADGVAAMRILVERAVMKAQVRLTTGRAVATYEPKPHDPTIHHQWRDAIEEAFVPRHAHAKSRDALPEFVRERRGEVSSVVEPPEWERSLPLMVADDEAFELSVPEVVPYRASTRH